MLPEMLKKQLNCVDLIITHKRGNKSYITFKAFEQGNTDFIGCKNPILIYYP